MNTQAPASANTATADPPARWWDSRWSAIVVLALAIALGLGTVRFVWAAGRALALVVLAGALAAALAPIVSRAARGGARVAAVVLVYLAATLLLLVAGWLILPRLANEVQEFAGRSQDLGAAIEQQLQGYLPGGVPVDRVISAVTSQLGGVVQQIPVQFASFAFDLLIVIFLSMYFLTVSPKLHWFLVSLFPRPKRRRASLVTCRMAAAMGGYFRGVAIDAAIVTALTWIALSFVGLEFALPLAVLAGFGEFVPYIGPIVAAIPAVGIGLLESVQTAVIVAATYVLLQQIESHVVTPNVMRTQTDIHPATVIVALTIGFEIGGLLGALVGIPLFAAARVLLRRVIAPAVRHAGRSHT